ncbi:hypothetical protein T265_07272 [Opisthorchis viverrini]|uniref:Uncharacterized protein n=1 Tax=Opisthorchis viverrini TaxID=6198 RepID=A0A074ZDI4_OPIVI|nr:hypothetical protein T265_07272 [Opisthorchis viverrini]KER25233.1 hypothetical protein T265_07272 [Opisthorchis viverrini]
MCLNHSAFSSSDSVLGISFFLSISRSVLPSRCCVRCCIVNCPTWNLSRKEPSPNGTGIACLDRVTGLERAHYSKDITMFVIEVNIGSSVCAIFLRTGRDKGQPSFDQITTEGMPSSKVTWASANGDTGQRSNQWNHPTEQLIATKGHPLLAARILTHAQHYPTHNHQPTATHYYAPQ